MEMQDFRTALRVGLAEQIHRHRRNPVNRQNPFYQIANFRFRQIEAVAQKHLSARQPHEQRPEPCLLAVRRRCDAHAVGIEQQQLAMGVIARHGGRHLHAEEFEQRIVARRQFRPHPGVADVACGHRGADEARALKHDAAAGVEKISRRHAVGQLFAAEPVNSRSLDLCPVIRPIGIINPRQPGHEVDLEVLESGLFEVAHHLRQKFLRRRMSRVEVMQRVVRFPEPFLRIIRVTGHGVGMFLIKPARFRNAESPAPDPRHESPLAHFPAINGQPVREVSVGAEPFAGQIPGIVTEIDLHILEAEPRIFPVDEIGDALAFGFSDFEPVAVPRQPADRRFGMTRRNAPGFDAKIGVFLQHPVRIAIFAPERRFRADGHARSKLEAGEIVDQRQLAHLARRGIVEHHRHRRRAHRRHHKAEEQRRMAGTAVDAHAAHAVMAGRFQCTVLDGFRPSDVFGRDKEVFPILEFAIRHLRGHAHAAGEPAAAGIEENHIVEAASRQAVEFGQVAAAECDRSCPGVGEFPFQHSPRPFAPQQFPAAKRRSRDNSAVGRQIAPCAVDPESCPAMVKHFRLPDNVGFVSARRRFPAPGNIPTRNAPRSQVSPLRTGETGNWFHPRPVRAGPAPRQCENDRSGRCCGAGTRSGCRA
ncbi:hypothetical protein SDC9_86584 [bioreactor metagenome]|uniref:Uncharacterized protein n=1 Tax=bioreactor metagenome TaxID=1076179 RepID=A0A644ZHZ7_9ZZZZ